MNTTPYSVDFGDGERYFVDSDTYDYQIKFDIKELDELRRQTISHIEKLKDIYNSQCSMWGCNGHLREKGSEYCFACNTINKINEHREKRASSYLAMRENTTENFAKIMLEYSQCLPFWNYEI